MPVIAVASPKGGAGKSTTAIILGTEMAQAGANVHFLDCDPNKSLTLWAEREKLPPRITFENNLNDGNIIKAIQKHDQDGTIVIVDLEGVASVLVSRAISRADLVITPMRATTLDATIGIRAISLIRDEEEMLQRTIKHAVVFTMTRAIQSKQHKGIQASLAEQGIDVIEPSLMERAAFSALFQFGGNLRTMPAQGKIENAIQNAEGFAEAVFKRLTGE